MIKKLFEKMIEKMIEKKNEEKNEEQQRMQEETSCILTKLLEQQQDEAVMCELCGRNPRYKHHYFCKACWDKHADDEEHRLGMALWSAMPNNKENSMEKNEEYKQKQQDEAVIFKAPTGHVTKCQCMDIYCACRTLPNDAYIKVRRGGQELCLCGQCDLPGDELVEMLVVMK